jgi:hypothetical protein
MEPTLPGTVQPGTAPAQDGPPPWRYAAPPGSRAEQLLDSLETARAEADEAEARAKNISDSIKAEVIPLAPPGTTTIIVAGTPYRPEFLVRWTESWRFDTKRFKAERLADWVRYAVKGGSWKLEKAKR